MTVAGGIAGAIGGIPGGPPGIIAGAIIGAETSFSLALRSEVTALAINIVAGKEISSGIALATEKLTNIVKASCPTVRDEEARAFVAGVLGITFFAADVKGATGQISAIKQQVGKTPNLSILHNDSSIYKDQITKPGTKLSDQTSIKPTALPEKILESGGSTAKNLIKNYAVEHNWPELPKIVKSLPEGYELHSPTKGSSTIGLEFKKGLHDTITIKQAKLDPKYPSQQVDYVSYIKDGKYIARNGDKIYKDGNTGNIFRIDAITNKPTMVPQEELRKLGITHPREFPEVHIPLDEFLKKWGKE